MMLEKSMIPPGYHFTPSDSELINCYLLKACTNLPMPYVEHVCERDLYSADPWDVLSDVHWDSVSGKKVTYVLSRLSKVTKNAKRNSRRTPSGTWKGQTTEKRILQSGGGELIGVTKMFTFMLDTTATTSSSISSSDHWIMHEYSLAGVSLTNVDLKIRDYVICRITCRKGKLPDPVSEDPRISPQITATNHHKRSTADDEYQGMIMGQDGAKMQKKMNPNNYPPMPTTLPLQSYYPTPPSSLQHYPTPQQQTDDIIHLNGGTSNLPTFHDDLPPDFDFNLSDEDLQILSQILVP